MDILKRYVGPGLLMVALLCGLSGVAQAQSREYKLKAAFILNFIKFVEWPGGQSGPIKVGILGDDPFKGELKKLEKKKVAGRTLKVSQFTDLKKAKYYQVIFTADPATAGALVKQVSGMPILTISDTPDFSKNGGCINLNSNRNRIRFSINKGSLKKSNLKASSKLLGLATDLYGYSAARETQLAKYRGVR